MRWLAPATAAQPQWLVESCWQHSQHTSVPQMHDPTATTWDGQQLSCSCCLSGGVGNAQHAADVILQLRTSARA